MKLNQLIALVSGKKTRIQKFLTDIHHGWKQDRITGIAKTYAPLDEMGEPLPPENRIVQVRDAVKVAREDANNVEIDSHSIIGTKILNHIFSF